VAEDHFGSQFSQQIKIKITRVDGPSLKGDVEAADEATGQRYPFCADQNRASIVFRQQGHSWVQIDPTPARSRIARMVVRQAH
jgi:hypothetical protein